MKKSLLSACSLSILTLALGNISPVWAQSIDYGSLETLFGQPVTMAATGTPQLSSQLATNMTIITADEIRQSGSRRIPEILSRVPGLDISQSSSVAADVGVRGYQQQMQSRLLVLIDGRQVFQDDYSRTIWENLPVNIDDIRQIEVVKGPASALFGSNAVGGVVNIVTYSALYDKTNVVSVSGGTQDSRSGDTTLSMPVGTSGAIKVSVGDSASNEFKTNRYNAYNVIGPNVSVLPGQVASTNNEWPGTKNPTHQYGAVTYDDQLAPDLVVDLSGNYSKSLSTEAYYSGLLDAVGDQVYSLRGGFTWETPIGTIKNTNYWNHSRVTNNEISVIYPYYADTTELIVSQLEDQFRLGADNTFRISTEYRHTDFHAELPNIIPQSDHILENVFAVGGMWLWQINDKLSWTNAGRVDDFNLGTSGQFWSGSLVPVSAYNRTIVTESANSGLVYDLSSQDIFRLTYGRAVEFPRLLDYGFNTEGRLIPTTRFFERAGAPDLKPTIVTNYEFAYDRKLPEIYSALTGSVYYMVNHSIITSLVPLPSATTSLGPKTSLGQSENVGQSDGVGGEIELKGKSPSGLRWDVSYSYASVSDSPGILAATGITLADSAPKHHGRILLGYSFGPFEVDLDEQITSKHNDHRNGAGNYVITDGYNTLSARIGYKFLENYTLAISGTTLTQSVTQTNAFPAVERQVFATLTARF